MSDTFDEPPDENEAYENLDEALDDEDLHGVGPEGGRDVEADLVVDETELEEAGGRLADPERLSMLDGGMDDPDGSGPPPHAPGDSPDAGWDVDPAAGRAGDEEEDFAAGDRPDPDDGAGRPGPDEPEEIDTDPGDWD